MAVELVVTKELTVNPVDAVAEEVAAVLKRSTKPRLALACPARRQ